MGRPRRGGPCGRRHQWLNLCKNNSDLRKLLPLYFPATAYSPSLSSPASEDSGCNITNQHIGDCKSKNEEHALKEISSSLNVEASINRTEETVKVLSSTYNIDEDATQKLHKLINFALISKSLNLSPIHWKCIPQLHSVECKNTAAICGVIIKKRRKRIKPHVEISKKSRKSQSSSSKNPNQITNDEENETVSSEAQLTSATVEPDAETTSVTNVVDKSLKNSNQKIKEDPDMKFCPETPKESVAVQFCRFCHCSGTFHSSSRRMCKSCHDLLYRFTREYQKADYLSCLRDFPCDIRWPTLPISTELVESTEPKATSDLAFGPILPNWCDACKVRHCLKLGFKPFTIRGPKSYNYAALKSLDLDELSIPSVQHRGRERRVTQYLELLKKDYEFEKQNQSDEMKQSELYVKVSTANCEIPHFLDSLWVRPTHLLSYSQLKTMSECTNQTHENSEIQEHEATNQSVGIISSVEQIPTTLLDEQNDLTDTFSQTNISSNEFDPILVEKKDLEISEQLNEDQSKIDLESVTINPDHIPTHCSSKSVDTNKVESTTETAFTCGLCELIKQSSDKELLSSIKNKLSQLLLSSSIYAISNGPIPISKRTYTKSYLEIKNIKLETKSENITNPCISKCSDNENADNDVTTTNTTIITSATPVTNSDLPTVTPTEYVIGEVNLDEQVSDPSAELIRDSNELGLVTSENPPYISAHLDNKPEEIINTEEKALNKVEEISTISVDYQVNDERSGQIDTNDTNAITGAITQDNNYEEIYNTIAESESITNGDFTDIQPLQSEKSDHTTLLTVETSVSFSNSDPSNANLQPIQQSPLLMEKDESTIIMNDSNSLSTEEVHLCGSCLLIFRQTIQKLFHKFNINHIDCLTELYINPEKFCLIQENNLVSSCCQINKNEQLCDSCLIYKFLHFLYEKLHNNDNIDQTLCEQIDHKSIGNLTKSFVLPIGGPLIIPLCADLDNARVKTNSLLDYRISHFESTNEENKIINPECEICHSVWSVPSYYELNSSSKFIICSGCLWTFKTGLLTATNNLHVRQLAKRLASAARSTNSCLPLLSSVNRKMLIDICRLTQLISNPCSKDCVNLSFSSSSPEFSSEHLSLKPLWITCPSCVVRRCLRLLPFNIPLHSPRWFRCRIKLLKKSKLLEDLDPRLIWPNSNVEDCQGLKPDLSHLSLADVEYNPEVIQRWLIPPKVNANNSDSEINTNKTECDSSSSESSEEDRYSTSSSGFSLNSADLSFSDRDSEYGAETWWLNGEIESNIIQPLETLSRIKQSPIKSKTEDSDTEPETDLVRAEEFTVNYVIGKRQRRLTARAAEAMAYAIERKSRKCLTNSSKLKLTSDDEQTNSNDLNKYNSIKSPVYSPVRSIDEVKEEFLQTDLPPTENTTSEEIDIKPIEKTNQVIECDQLANRTKQDDEDIHDRDNAVNILEKSEEAQVDTMDSMSHESDTANSQTTKSKAPKRKSSPSDNPVVRGKRRPKINHRFLDEFDSDLRFIAGSGRNVRDSSEVSNGSDGSRNSERSSVDHQNNGHSSRARLPSWYVKRHSGSHIQSKKKGYSSFVKHGINKQNSLKASSSTRNLYNRGVSSSHKDKKRIASGLGPRVKQVSRPSIKPEESRYSSALSAMVHAARLAAVGAKVPGGVSPVHAALAATAARSNKSKDDDNIHNHNKNMDKYVNGENARGISRGSGVSGKSGLNRLSSQCGQCPACLGLIQPCGQCSDCRYLDKDNPRGRGRPCKELMCFRRRSTGPIPTSGPRVKIPSSFPSPGSNISFNTFGQKGNSSNNHQNLDRFNSSTLSSRDRQKSSPLNSSSKELDSRPDNSVSLLQTVPGLAQQLEFDAWLPQTNLNRITSSITNSSSGSHTHLGRPSAYPRNDLHVRSDVRYTSIRGGDLGMHFNSASSNDNENDDLDRVRPVEGEVIDNELANYGGYAVVTTLAAAPPKEICYACGSGGGQLLFCVSCAEPFHFYCVERQFRPRRKDHFICRNCTVCKLCRRAAAELRCIHCLTGYHPDCLPDYAPAKSDQRGSWTCPDCTSCLHCGVKACKPAEHNDPTNVYGGSPRCIYTPWSTEVSKCAACSLAESRGDICPECDRTYLPTTKQMVQCDSCQLWMHRTCTKLTVDEYEWIARMPHGQLSKFVVTCSVCQKERKKSRQLKTQDSAISQLELALQSESGTDTGDDEVPKFDRENEKPTNGAEKLRQLARDTLMERMSNLVNSCRRSSRSDHLSSPVIEESSNSVSSPTHSKRTGFWTNANKERNNNSSQQHIPQYDGICDSDSGEELSAVVEAAASLWPSNVPVHKTIVSNCSNLSNQLFIDQTNTTVNTTNTTNSNNINNADNFYSNQTYLTPNIKLKNYSSLNDTHLNVMPYTGPSRLVQRFDQSNSNCLNNNSNNTNSLHIDTATNLNESTSIQSVYHNNSNRHNHSNQSMKSDSHHIQNGHNIQFDNSSLKDYQSHSIRRRYSSSSSSSSKSIPLPTVPPINANWLVNEENEQIWTSPRSLLYRLLIRILQRLSVHPITSPYAISLRRLLKWLSSVTETYFPWLCLNDMAGDVRDILRQCDGKFDEVKKYFNERSLIELHELMCPVIAKVVENSLRFQCNPNGNGYIPIVINNITMISTCFSSIQKHLKENHPTCQLNSNFTNEEVKLTGSSDLNALIITKRFLDHCKRSRCQRPHEVELLEQMKQETRDDRWVEHWSSVEEKMVIQNFHKHLLKLFEKHEQELGDKKMRELNLIKDEHPTEKQSNDDDDDDDDANNNNNNNNHDNNNNNNSDKVMDIVEFHFTNDQSYLNEAINSQKSSNEEPNKTETCEPINLENMSITSNLDTDNLVKQNNECDKNETNNITNLSIGENQFTILEKEEVIDSQFSHEKSVITTNTTTISLPNLITPPLSSSSSITSATELNESTLLTNTLDLNTTVNKSMPNQTTIMLPSPVSQTDEMLNNPDQDEISNCCTTQVSNSGDHLSDNNINNNNDSNNNGIDGNTSELVIDWEKKRFYFALDKYWIELMNKYSKTNILCQPRIHLVDLDEEDELNQKLINHQKQEDNNLENEYEDVRRCLLCAYHGDDNIEGRLLYTGSDTWVHVNCALWSNDVYEEDSGELIGLADALRRARSSRCVDCGKFGATLYCSNNKKGGCPLSFTDSNHDSDETTCAIHFACALRRCPPTPPSVFTADRSWFCSPECHRASSEHRLIEALKTLRTSTRSNRKKKLAYLDAWDQSSDEDGSFGPLNPANYVNHPAYSSIEEAIADDLEPIGLGDLLVCRRVFVPSNCFLASLYPEHTLNNSLSNLLFISPNDFTLFMNAAQKSISNLSVSPNSLAFIQRDGLSANNLVITIGSLRVDRLGEIGEASDSLTLAKWNNSIDLHNSPDRSNYLCPINYRARRIYWSWAKLDDRVSYTLQIRQIQATCTSTNLETDRKSCRLITNSTVNTTNQNHSASPISKMPRLTVGSMSNSRILKKTHLIPSNELMVMFNDPKTTRLPILNQTLTPNSKISINNLTGTSNSINYVDTNKCVVNIHSSGAANIPTHNVPISNCSTSSLKIVNTMSLCQSMNQKPLHTELPSPTLVKPKQQQQQQMQHVILSAQPQFQAFPPATQSQLLRINPTVVPISNVDGSKVVTLSPKCRSGQILTLNPSNSQYSNLNQINNIQTNLLNRPQLQTLNINKPFVLSNNFTMNNPITTTSMNTTCNMNNIMNTYSSKIYTNNSNIILNYNTNLNTTNTTLTNMINNNNNNNNSGCITAGVSGDLNQIGYGQNNVQLTNDMNIAHQIAINTASSNLQLHRPTLYNKMNKPISIVQKPGNFIRIQHIQSTQKTGLLTTPTKDLQLASQLDGLFQNLPASRASPNRNPSITSVARQVGPRLLPQLDGTLDDDDDFINDRKSNCSQIGVNRRLHKIRSSSSLASNDSSYSDLTAASGRSHSRRSQLNRNSKISLSKDRMRTKLSKGYMTGSSVRTIGEIITPQPAKRRWIEERTRQQELARLVSKAKQANHARLYQNEIEKHARSFRLRFSVDGIVRAAPNPIAAWRAVIMRVTSLRERHGLPPLICTAIDGWSQFGLNHRYIVFLIEQMRGAFHCYRYHFRYHWRRIDRLRQRFTPPVPWSEGCSRAVPWTKPRLPRHHARDPLSFLSCAANPPPRPLINSGHELSSQNHILSPDEPTKLLSPNEQITCREAAHQAATLVADQLKLPFRVRKNWIAKAVVQATGIPLQSTSIKSTNSNEDDCKLEKKKQKASNSLDLIFDDSENDEASTTSDDDEDDMDEEDEEENMGTIAAQFSRVLSGRLARLYRVSVHPSRIHGRGLFALRDFREDEMVIEYTGELIRNSVCEAREIRYRAAGVDCYMFRIDQDWVIDATYAGNAARFINHSCEPNCYAKVITVDDRKHIVILAQRKIYPGEELTYDYRFPKESDKLLCNCGSFGCRKYLN